jgi:anaerobic dimethyl sulfoxide reductase subunit A
VDGRPELEQWRRHLYGELQKKEGEVPPFEDFCAAGGYDYQSTTPYVAYQKQREDPAAHPFATPSGKIEIFSKRIYEMNDPAERPAIPKYVPCTEGPGDPLTARYPLQLVGWHTKRRAHSIHDNNPWLEEAEPQRLWMHPSDAAARGIADGEVAEVYNARGRVHTPVWLTRRVMPGVVAMPQGAWYTPDENGVDVRGNINTLTLTHKPTPYAKGNPQHTTLVQVKKREG